MMGFYVSCEQNASRYKNRAKIIVSVDHTQKFNSNFYFILNIKIRELENSYTFNV